MKFTVYFEFFGRKMKKKVVAKDENSAKIIIQNRLTFIKVESEKKIDLSDKNFKNVFDQFESMF